MTDKEKRELKDGVISIFKRFNILDHTATIGGLRDDILRYINSLQEEPKKCMYSKDNYTEEDRKVLCEGCEEECKYVPNISPVFDEGYWERLGEEPISDDLEQAIDTYLATYFGGEKEKQDWPFLKKMAIHFAKWQKQQIMKYAVDACVTDIRTYKEENEVDFTAMYEKGIIQYEIEQEVKLIIIKED